MLYTFINCPLFKNTAPKTISTHNKSIHCHSSIQLSSSTRRQFLRIFTLISLSTTTTLDSTPLYSQTLNLPKVTDHVYFDISVAGKPCGRILIDLYGDEAPKSVDTFKNLVNGTLRSRSGKTTGYRYSQASRVVSNKRIELGRIKQIDAVNQQPGTPQRQTIPVPIPENRDTNLLSHDQPGLVSVKRGGSFEFNVLLDADSTLDDQSIVIGRIVDGMDVIQRLSKVPTNKKTNRDGFRNVGKAIGDARAKVDVCINNFNKTFFLIQI